MEKLLLTLGDQLFLIFGAMALGGALTMVFAKNAVHSVMGFLLAMCCIAGCYFTLSAEFMAVAQLLVYAGGIVVLFLFVVMLVELAKSKERSLFHRVQTPFAVGGVLVALITFVSVFWQSHFGPNATKALVLPANLASASEKLGNAQMVSRGLYADFILPFEILSVILLVALVGAVVLAKSERV